MRSQETQTVKKTESGALKTSRTRMLEQKAASQPTFVQVKRMREPTSSTVLTLRQRRQSNARKYPNRDLRKILQSAKNTANQRM